MIININFFPLMVYVTNFSWNAIDGGQKLRKIFMSFDYNIRSLLHTAMDSITFEEAGGDPSGGVSTPGYKSSGQISCSDSCVVVVSFYPTQ
jgi:hypothetical protein